MQIFFPLCLAKIEVTKCIVQPQQYCTYTALKFASFWSKLRVLWCIAENSFPATLWPWKAWQGNYNLAMWESDPQIAREEERETNKQTKKNVVLSWQLPPFIHRYEGNICSGFRKDISDLSGFESSRYSKSKIWISGFSSLLGNCTLLTSLICVQTGMNEAWHILWTCEQNPIVVCLNHSLWMLYFFLLFILKYAILLQKIWNFQTHNAKLILGGSRKLQVSELCGSLIIRAGWVCENSHRTQENKLPGLVFLDLQVAIRGACSQGVVKSRGVLNRFKNILKGHCQVWGIVDLVYFLLPSK